MSNKGEQNEDFIRTPDKTKTMKLIDDFDSNFLESFDSYSMYDENDYNNKIHELSRNDIYEKLINLIFTNYNEFDIYCNVEALVVSLQQYLENIIDEIILQFDICWSIRNNIDIFCADNEFIRTTIKNIFVPDSQNEYDKFQEMMNNQKETYEQKNLEKINEQIDNEKKILEISKKRHNLMDNFMKQLNKLSIYDNKIKELSNCIIPIIDDYINLKNEYIIMKNELYVETKKFIEEIRMDQNIKNEIIGLIKIL